MPEENALPSTDTPSAPEAATPAALPPSPDPPVTPVGDGAEKDTPTAADGAPLPPYTAADPNSSPSAQNQDVSPPSSPATPEAVDSAAQGPEPALSETGQAAPANSAPAVPAEGPTFGQTSSAPEFTSTVGIPSAPGGEMSVKDMFLNADPVVQGVMALLLLASLATWVIIFEKTFILRNTSRSVMLFKRAAAKDGQDVSEKEFPPLARSIVEAGIRESRDAAGNETRCDYRERVERSMRAEFSGLMDRVGYRVMFLATVGAVSPFVGLFGTVWGIMHSFVGIAASGETTLAVVAPGIAEALFATAMGLVAAIPAVVAYNKITGTMKKITKEALSGIGFLGNRLARNHFSGLEPEGD